MVQVMKKALSMGLALGMLVSSVAFASTHTQKEKNITKANLTVNQNVTQKTKTASASTLISNQSNKIQKVKCLKNCSIPVSAINIEENELITGVNQTVTVHATVSPSNATNKTITWSVSNPTIASVSSSGVITGLSSGTTTVTATSQNGTVVDSKSVTVVSNISKEINIYFGTETMRQNNFMAGKYALRAQGACMNGDDVFPNLISASSNSSDVYIANIDPCGIPGSIIGNNLSINETKTKYALITVMLSDGNTAYMKANVHPFAQATGFSASQKSITITTHTCANLTKAFSPLYVTNRNVQVLSSNEYLAHAIDMNDDTIAICGSGTGYGGYSNQILSGGTTTITLTSEDGNYSDVVTVTVNPAPVLDPLTLTKTLKPSNSVLFNWNNIADVDRYELRFYTAGTNNFQGFLFFEKNNGTLATEYLANEGWNYVGNTFVNLIHNQTYDVDVRAYKDGSVPSFSNKLLNVGF